MTKEEAISSKGRYGKIPGGNGFFYGKVVEVHESGLCVKFQRGYQGKCTWVDSKVVSLHPLKEASAIASEVKGKSK